MRVAILTSLALCAFAANSLLCRAALAGGLVDPVSFTSLRVSSGAAMLLPLPFLLERPSRAAAAAGSWSSALALFTYAIAFSCAYVTLDAGMGALILFAAVQVTMIGVALLRGERPRRLEWTGLTVALGGLVYLVSPGLAAPNPLGAGAMALAGAAWGVYSLRGQNPAGPVSATAGNFARAAPMALAASGLAWVLWRESLHAAPGGLWFAVVSGAVTSGLGYVLWYFVLRDLAATPAAIAQLAVPVLAAAGGVLFLGEVFTLRLGVGGAAVLGGVAIATAARSRARPSR